MVFALATDDRSLMVFATETEAIAYCEGIDVEEGVWLFFANDGSPLEPYFSRPSQRGRLVVVSGTYTLRPAKLGSLPALRDRLHEVTSVEGVPGISSIADVERLLTAGSKGDASQATRA
jgi:hypothetical protein